MENLEKLDQLQARIDLLKQKFKEASAAYKSSSEYQKDLEKYADLRNSLNTVQNAAKDAAEAQKKESKDAADAAKDAAEKVKQAARDAADVQKKAARDAADASRQAARQQADDARNAARAQREADEEAVSNARRKGRRLIEISRGVEDAQYGVAGVLNNIPSILESFSVPAKFVGGIQIAVVAAAQLYKHWDDLMGLFGQGKTESEASAMEKLAKNTEKTADEAERLARYQAVEKKVGELGEKPKTEAEKRTEEMVTETLQKIGPRKIVDSMLSQKADQFDAAIPGLKDEKGNLLKNDDGSAKTALSEYARAKREFDALDKGIGYSELDKQNARSNLLDAEKKRDEARAQAGLHQLATNAVPQFYPQNLNRTVDQLGKDPNFLKSLDWKERRDLEKGLRAATPEGQEEEQDRLDAEHHNRQEQDHREKLRKFREENDTATIDADEEAAWDALQESIKGVKEWAKDLKDDIKKELKDKTWLNTPEGQQTYVQKQAKKQHDAFEGKVAASLAAGDFLDEDGNIKNNEDLTPAQQEAGRRFTKDQSRQQKEKTIAERASRDAKEKLNDQFDSDPQADSKLEFEFLRRLGSGRNASQVQAAMTARLKDQLMRADPDLSEEDAAEMAGKRIRGAKEGVFRGVTGGKAGQDRVEMHGGTAEFLAAIQGGFTRDNNPNKGVEDKLQKLYDLIASDQNSQQAVIGQFG